MNFSFLKEKGSKYIIWILLGILVLVMIIPVGSKETTGSSNTAEETTQGELEEKLKKVLSAMEGVGEVEVMITTKEGQTDLFSDESGEGEVLGVVVVAEGAGTPSVEAKILDAVKA